ncbi:MAG: DUF309 domain-containing protein [Nitrososphaerota archaeon]|nr:DUF309 domain-containing protein [Candidatus Calditenuaceae archaeon]MDW8072694.1 DUF309 domain-containing protein [Nitrososphaerota archaeon]
MPRVIVALMLKGLDATPENHAEMMKRARGLLAPHGCRVIDARIGRRRVEVDFFADDIQSAVSALSTWAPIEYFREVGVSEDRSEEELVSLAAELFNEERFWEAHEVLEQVWRTKRGAEREVLSGLIKLAAAFVHLQKGRPQNFFKLLNAAMSHLSGWSREKYHLIDIARLRDEIRTTLASRSPRYITFSA